MTDQSLAASQARQDAMDPKGATARQVSRDQLTRLQAARNQAGWHTVAGEAINVAIYLHIGATATLALSQRHLNERLEREPVS